jgi:hypothetical protein
LGRIVEVVHLAVPHSPHEGEREASAEHERERYEQEQDVHWAS